MTTNITPPLSKEAWGIVAEQSLYNQKMWLAADAERKKQLADEWVRKKRKAEREEQKRQREMQRSNA